MFKNRKKFKITEAFSNEDWVSFHKDFSDTYKNTDWRYDVFGSEAGLGNIIWNRNLLNADLQGLPHRAEISEDSFYRYDKGGFGDNSFMLFIEAKARRDGKYKNNDKLRLASELIFDPLASTRIQKTDYVSSLMSDKLASNHVYDKNILIWDGPNEFIDLANNKLRSLKDTPNISNQIGASTIAFSIDGHLLLIRQTKKNQHSVGKLAPSGSGSLDWADIEDSKPYWKIQKNGFCDLLAIAKYGAMRELLEECGLRKKIKQIDLDLPINYGVSNCILPLGFAQNVKRAGKPEFYFLAVLPFTELQIKHALLDKSEKPFTQNIEGAISERINLLNDENSLKSALHKVCKTYKDINSVKKLLGPQGGHIKGLSYPFLQGISLLEAALQDQTVNTKILKWLKEKTIFHAEKYQFL